MKTRKSRRAVPSLEGLETRANPSTITLIDGNLNIIGTDGPDDVSVHNTTIILSETEDYQLLVPAYRVRDHALGTDTLFFASDVNAVYFEGLGGDDWFNNDTGYNNKPALLAHANGGDGDDTFLGGAGTDIFSGGDGDDWLFGYVGNDFLYGDDGLDHLRGGSHNDLLDGGVGDSGFLTGDDLEGGTGADTFQEDPLIILPIGPGGRTLIFNLDYPTDFNASEGDSFYD